MSLDQIVAEALQLPANQKALLAESLWESLGDPFLHADTEEDNLRLALHRDRQIESGEVKTLTHDELMRRLRQ